MPDQAPPDDRTIEDGDHIYRRARGDQIKLLPDGSGYRGSSAILVSSGGPLSADLASLCTPEQTRDGAAFGDFHVVAIPVKALRDEHCSLEHAPDLEHNNPAHVHVYGGKRDGALTNSQANRISQTTRVIFLNPDALIPD